MGGGSPHPTFQPVVVASVTACFSETHHRWLTWARRTILKVPDPHWRDYELVGCERRVDQGGVNPHQRRDLVGEVTRTSRVRPGRLWDDALDRSMPLMETTPVSSA